MPLRAFGDLEPPPAATAMARFEYHRSVETTPAIDVPALDHSTDHVLGVVDAEHVLLEYGSYACSHCRDAQHVIERLRERLGDRLQYVFRHKPLQRDPWAEPTAMLAEYAAEQGDFWTAHAALMAEPIRSDADLVRVAASLGVDKMRLAEIQNNESLRARVRQSAEAAVGVTSTPTFFIDGRRYTGAWDEMSLIEALDTPMADRIERVARAFAGWAPATGVLLALCAVTALSLANSPWATAFEALWTQELALEVGGWRFAMPVRSWINDALMSVFFLVVGLEIKRELTIGALAKPSVAALPIAAAVGGMVVPATLYLALTWGSPATSGWGIPMATDIAFSLGLLALLGRRVPLTLKVFLTALAIVDDLGAITVIALFYGHGFDLSYAAAAVAVFIVLLGLNAAGVYRSVPYAVAGVVLWVCVYASGVHATLAGILLAVAVPTRPPPNLRGLLAQAQALLDPEIERLAKAPDAFPARSVMRALDAVHDRVESPAHRLERMLEPWSSFLILPVFALANAGVALTGMGESTTLALAIAVGLVLGKPLGIVAGVWAVTRVRSMALPGTLTWPSIVGVGSLAGVGFTMSIFISNEAFTDVASIGAAKLAVLGASVAAALIGLVILSRSLPAVSARSNVGQG